MLNVFYNIKYPNKKYDTTLSPYNALVDFIIFALLFLFFISGYGPYRIVVSIFLFYLMRVGLQIFRVDLHIINRFVLPALIITLYFDINIGPLLDSGHTFSVIISFLISSIIFVTLKLPIELLVQHLCSNKGIAICPSCLHYHNYVVSSCTNCGYGKSHFIVKNFNNDIKVNNICKMIELRKNELINSIVKISPWDFFQKNDTTSFITFLVITDCRIIALDCLMIFGNGWRIKHEINCNDIIAIGHKIRRLGVADKLELTISTMDENSYALILRNTLKDSYKIKDIELSIQKCQDRALKKL